jgi:hypothetical protein
MATGQYQVPWSPDGSLLHHPYDGHRFSHYEDPVTGERLERDQIFERVLPVDPTSVFSFVERKIRDYRMIHTEAIWKENEPFHASLQLQHVISGRSAKYVVWTAVNNPLDGRTYPMFVRDLLDLARTAGIQKGGIASGRWIATKRGQNFGLKVSP